MQVIKRSGVAACIVVGAALVTELLSDLYRVNLMRASVTVSSDAAETLTKTLDQDAARDTLSLPLRWGSVLAVVSLRKVAPPVLDGSGA